MIKSSINIHKRPFMFPIPIYNKNNETHRKLAKTGIKSETVVLDFFLNNPKISADKTRTLLYHKLTKIEELTELIIFN